MLFSRIITTSKLLHGVKYGWHVTHYSSRPVSHQFLQLRAFEHLPKVRCYSKFKKDELSPLMRHLIDAIKISGPMSVAHYMRQVLTNPLSGYYMKGDVFGVQGDFITSPEISQMFGEWMSLGRPSKTQIVEFGPGRGTLMDDMLRALARFPDIYNTILGVHLIEASPGLREIQRKTLSEKIDAGSPRIRDSLAIRRNDGIEVIWNEDFKDVPDNWSMVVAHEFFDALPIHKFENREYIDNKGQKKTSWRELRVDIDDSEENLNYFRLIVENKESDVSRTLTSHPRFDKFSNGDRIEVSLDSWNIMHSIAQHLNRHGGSALVIDYGQDFIQRDTLRAIKKHSFVHPMASPGEADLSADVDFSLLKDACNNLVSTFGPITQSHFLHSMGIQTRLQMLLKNAKDEERKRMLISGYQRLVDPIMMGKTYKVMAVAKVEENKIPIGFEQYTKANKQGIKIDRPLSPLQPRSPLQPFRPNHTRNFMTSREGHQFTNRLSNEKSPYLLQHAHNPVDWYAWSEEAFAKARQENKPIFLSVGYSTCHWCHVMERESFESEKVAAIMNREFINIKVDREEQPGVDKVYMTFLQMTSGRGGWPMSVFLTPDLHPFYAGTYYPKDGFISILIKISDIWKTDPNTLKESGQDVVHQIKQYLTSQPGGSTVNMDFSVADKTFEHYIKTFDSTHGGFGGAPKFPTPTQFSFLFSFYYCMHISHANTEEIKVMNIAEIRDLAQTLRIDLPDSVIKEDLIRSFEAGVEKINSTAIKALEMGEFTLKKIATGGIHDHVGGGFHRYSTDNQWHIPHFEKMLYDQGQLLIAFVTAYSITKKEFYAEVAKDIIRYVSRDLCDPAGGFYSAEDADSYPYHGAKEAKEGAFCVWTKEEIHELLPQQNASIFEYHFGVKENGNVLPKQDPHGELTKKNVLFEAYTIDETAIEFNLTPEKVKDILRISKEELLNIRFERRPKPHCDDKILTSWNGLMISGLAYASQVLNDPSFLNLAIKAADFIKENLYNPETNTLLRSFRDGPSDVRGFIDDYSYLIRALIDLYEASFNEKWLRWAFDLQEKQNELFWDNDGSGYFNVAEGDKNMLFRMKDEQDGAEPSANSVSTQNLLRLANIIDEPSYQEKAEKTFTAFQTILLKYPQSMPSLVTSLMTKLKGIKQIMLLGPSDDPTFESFCAAVNAKFTPNRVILRVQPGGILEEKNQTIASLLTTKTSRVEAHVCQNFACGLPIKDLEEFKKKLEFNY